MKAPYQDHTWARDEAHGESYRALCVISHDLRAASQATRALAQDVVDLVRETMCDTMLAELNAAPVDARSRSRGGKQVWPPHKMQCPAISARSPVVGDHQYVGAHSGR